MGTLVRPVATLALTLALLAGGCGGGGNDSAGTTEGSTADQATGAVAQAELDGVKSYLLDHTELLTGFTAQFKKASERYYDLAEESGFDTKELWAQHAAEVGPLVEKLKAIWVEGNPYYEEMEGIVAGTPSLSKYDVIIDAGSSGVEDPESAVPFDLTLPDGQIVKKPGNFYNVTEGALWGTLPANVAPPSTPVDLDGNGTVEFGEVLPDPGLMLVATRDFDKYATELADSAAAWDPTVSDAFTAMVVMVPTMSEYFGQWKVSRFVEGSKAQGEAFNVVSRLSDIHDILAGLEVIYAGVRPAVAELDPAQAEQTGKELGDLSSFIGELYTREQGGGRFTPEQADTLGTEAQDRGTSIAGQISQAAAQLGVQIEQ